VQKRLNTLPLLHLRFPIMAWVSILHRLSGLCLFLMIPGLLWIFQASLESESRFINVQECLRSLSVKICLWIMLSILFYHTLAGIRHLLLDFHIGISKRSGRFGAWVVLGLSIIISILWGYYLW
jgi:succinate dehydrogenase / fumarate reductase cytochrome b subunit